jgi:hypothetical protein
MKHAFLAALLVAISATLGFAAESTRPALREYDILRAFPPGRLATLSAGDIPDAHGFTGNNRAHGKWIESGPQRGSCRGVIAAVVAGDLAAADNAWRGIEVAFAHQRPDGGFIAHPQANGKVASAFPANVETAYFFLQELGRAILVIRQSPHAAHFTARLAVLEPKLRRAADYINSGFDTIVPKVGHSVNRVIIAAKAFGTCGVVLGDDKLIAQARRLIAHALTLRDKEGVFIENGGRDSSYNVVSILFGSVLALHVSLPEFEAILPAAVDWQLTRVLPTGEIDVKNNTRTGVGKEANAFGQAKTVNYTEVIFALTYYGLIHRDPAALDAASRVFDYTHQNPKPRKAPP